MPQLVISRGAVVCGTGCLYGKHVRSLLPPGKKSHYLYPTYTTPHTSTLSLIISITHHPLLLTNFKTTIFQPLIFISSTHPPFILTYFNLNYKNVITLSYFISYIYTTFIQNINKINILFPKTKSLHVSTCHLAGRSNVYCN